MRIVILNNFSYVTGGADVHCFDIAAMLRASGHEVMFLATASPKQTETVGAFVPLSVTNATRDSASLSKQARVASRAFWNRSAAAAMDEIVRRFRPDIVHAHKVYPHLSVAPVVTARRHRIPIVQTVHDYEFVSANAFDASRARWDTRESRLQYRTLNSGLLQIKRRFHIPSVDSWVAVSRSIAEIYAQAGITATVLPNFTFTPVAEATTASRDGLLYIGRLTVEKGVRDVLEVARRLPETNVRIAGYGALEREVQDAAATLPNLEYLGALPQDAVAGVLRTSRACVMPSHWREPGPLACLEAMAAGTPVVAYDNGGLAEYVNDANAGIVVDPNVERLVEACRTLTNDEDAWQRYADHATQAASTTHHPGSYLAKLLAVYDETVALQPQRDGRRKKKSA